MAINAYCGLQGSGKSYEVVSGPIVEAVANGRRVVTNIDGIDGELIRDYVIKKKRIDSNCCGTIVQVTNDRILQPGFFPDGELPDQESVVQAGDLVAVDEAWRFWPDGGGRLPHEHMQFFRMHRHYTHPDTGVACDVALMTQDIGGLHRSLKNVIELSFRTVKMKSIGLARNYRVEMYEGWKQNSRMRIDYFVRKYSAEIFPLYRSYGGKNGQETQMDKRQNVLRNPRLWVYAITMIMVVTIASYFIYRFFNGAGIAKHKEEVKPPPQGLAVDVSPTVTPKHPALSDLRLAGEIFIDGQRWVVLADVNGRVRLENAAVFVGRGIGAVGIVEGARVASWTGSLHGKGDAEKRGAR